MGLPPLSAHKKNKEIPSMAVLALFIETIDGIAYFAIYIFSYLSGIISNGWGRNYKTRSVSEKVHFLLGRSSGQSTSMVVYTDRYELLHL